MSTPTLTLLLMRIAVAARRVPLALAVLAALATFAAPRAFAQSWTPPPPAQRCPSKWGATDERGAANHVTAASVLQAAKLIRTGEIIELGRVLASTMPLFGTRTFDLHTKRTNGPLGANKRYSNEELVVTELGQVGTQLDMFSHQGIDGQSYNCIPIDSIATRNGFQKLGVEKIGTLFARGVLIDVAAFKGVEMLSAGYEITPADLQGAIAKQQLTLAKGDAVLIHTGWGRLWDQDVPRYGASAPGIGVAAATWLASQDVLLIGCDTASVEVSPNPDKTLDSPVHQIALVINGIFLLENLKLDELASKDVKEFALIVEPLKIRGGTGSTVAPIAVR
jgi:kynurenine formamidase